MSEMTVVALDAMGGDNAPGEMIKGAVEAVRKRSDMKVLLVGKQDLIEEALAGYTLSLIHILYKEMLTGLISDWRTLWGDIKLPFLFVQLPGFRKWLMDETENQYPIIRKCQQPVSYTHLFSDTIPAGKDSLDSLQQLLETFYTEILKRKEDLSLLLLSEWYLPSKEAKTASILLPYINKLEPAFFSALKQAQTEHLLKTNFDISDSLHFFQQMNLTMLEHIALIKKTQYAKKKKELLQQIHQLISSYILSIKKCRVG